MNMTQVIVDEVNAVLAAFSMPNIRVKLEDGAHLPERAHKTDAGARLLLRRAVPDWGCGMRKIVAIAGVSAIALLALTAWALCAIGDALETFEDPCHWRDEGGEE